MTRIDAFDRAVAAGKRQRATTPAATAARYDTRRKRVVVSFASGLELTFPPEAVEGLEGASARELGDIAISSAGFGLHFPQLDADIYLPTLLEGVTGSRRWMAARMGAAGGKATTKAKASAARENGKLGGRPRKKA